MILDASWYEGRQKKIRFFVIGFAVFICFLIFGFWFLTIQEQEAKRDARRQLDLIAGQKVLAIENWRQDQLDDARTLTASPLFKRFVQRIVDAGTADDSRENIELLQLFAESNDIEDIVLLDSRGRVLLSLEGKTPDTEAYSTAMAEAIKVRGPVMTDLHQDDSYLFPHLSTVTPVFSAQEHDSSPEAVLMMIHDARRFLFPLLQSWPVPSKSAETLLVRGDGDDVVYLSELRHRKTDARNLRLPLTQGKMAAAAGVRGHVGPFEGKDYRGKEVVSVVLPVSGSPWIVVTKVDASEMYAPWRSRAWLILGLLTVLLLFAAFLGFFLWQRFLKSQYKNMYDIEASLRASLERDSVILKSIDDGVIATDTEGCIRMINAMAEQLTGWTAAEAEGKHLSVVFNIVDENSLQRLEDPVGMVLRKERAVALDNHTLLIDREGRNRTIADSAAPIRDGKGSVTGVVIVFRDQSKEREMERERDVTITLLQIMNQAGDLKTMMSKIFTLIQKVSKCEAVGIRYRKGDDYPYFETRGFPSEFVEAESRLCEYDGNNEVVRDNMGNPVLECMCGNVIRGRFNPALPFFTPNGSFWTNSTTELLSGTSEADRQSRTRNRCHGEGYESVALIPLRYGGQNIGLLQVNDKRAGCFSPKLIALLERLASSMAVGLVQKQSAEALQENKAFITAVMDNLPIGIAVNSVNPQVKFSYMNTNFCRIYRVRPEDLTEPDKFWDAVYEDPVFREQIKKRVLDDCASGDPDRMHWDDVPLIRENQETSYISALNTPLPAEGVMISIVWDTTARKQAEEEKIKLQDQLNQSQKIESVGRLAGGVAHDFNNMLGVILGHAELALGHIGTEHAIYNDLQEIRRAAQRSADLTRQLLAFARKQTISPVALDLNHTISSMLKLLRRLIGEDIELVWKPGTGLWPVKMDPSQIDQILANLCVNARDAISGLGRMIIETANVTFDAKYCSEHSGIVIGDFVMLAVSDDGCGMSREVQENLFEPFFTTKELGKGTGLGLATVFGAVKQNNGFINVYSEPGMGTIFKIYLPRYWGKSLFAKNPPIDEVPRGHGEKILVVEDEKAFLKMTVAMLEKQGYSVIPVNSPSEALQLAKEPGTGIRLLITDVVMPQMNGRELADKLKKDNPNLAVLFTSGYTADVIAHHGVLDEGVDFLQKPFSSTTLATKIHRMLNSG